jgi:hypothetical protein
LVYGKVALRAMPPHFWLWVLVGGAAFGVIYWRSAEGKLEARKAAVMAKQRAIAVALGPKIQPFREQVEGWARELAADGPADFLAPGDALKDLSEAPGVYLRLRRENTKSAKQIRKAAQASLLDGFTSCLFVSPTGLPTEGNACRVTSECLPGSCVTNGTSARRRRGLTTCAWRIGRCACSRATGATSFTKPTVT